MKDQPLFIEFRPNMRRLIADAIESLILLLDEIDGDENLEDEPDLEDGRDDEPSLGATHALNQEEGWNAARADIDLEFEGDGAAECDLEDDEREPDADAQDPWSAPAHLPGGNGSWLPGGYPLSEDRGGGR